MSGFASPPNKVMYGFDRDAVIHDRLLGVGERRFGAGLLMIHQLPSSPSPGREVIESLMVHLSQSYGCSFAAVSPSCVLPEASSLIVVSVVGFRLCNS